MSIGESNSIDTTQVLYTIEQVLKSKQTAQVKHEQYAETKPVERSPVSDMPTPINDEIDMRPKLGRYVNVWA